MNVIVMIDGREAIPVRAIPFLTNWETMSPDAIAEALAHEDELHWDYFFPLTALRFESSQPKPIAASWWENFPAKHLSAISATLKARETAGELTHEQAYIEWRRQSLLELPSGVFVWKDEFAFCHSSKYNSYAMTTIRNGKELSKEEQAKRYSLEFDPYIADLETCAAVMQGFERLQHSIVNDGSGQHSDRGAVNERPEEKSAKQTAKLDEASAGAIEQQPSKSSAEVTPSAQQRMTGYECDKAEYWQKSDAWTLNETRALLNGQWPVRGNEAPTSLNASLLAVQTSITHTVIEDGIEHHLIEQRTENALFNPVPEGTSITELIENAIAAGSLTPLPIRTNSKNKEEPGVLLRPSEVIAWANARGCFPDFPFDRAEPASAAAQETAEAVDPKEEHEVAGTRSDSNIRQGDFRTMSAEAATPHLSDAPEEKRPTETAAKLSPLWAAIKPYILQTIRAGQFSTAKQLFNKLESNAGKEGSPFEKGATNNSDCLFVREISATLSQSTLRNNFKKLCSEANK